MLYPFNSIARRKRRTKSTAVYPGAVGSGRLECFNEKSPLCPAPERQGHRLVLVYSLRFSLILHRIRIFAAEGQTIIPDEKKREKRLFLDEEREIPRSKDKRSLFNPLPGKTEREKNAVKNLVKI